MWLKSRDGSRCLYGFFLCVDAYLWRWVLSPEADSNLQYFILCTSGDHPVCISCLCIKTSNRNIKSKLP